MATVATQKKYSERERERKKILKKLVVVAGLGVPRKASV
jgi:hypothetical protein